MGRGDSNSVSIREALVLWVVLIVAVLRWSKPASSDAQSALENTRTASRPVERVEAR